MWLSTFQVHTGYLPKSVDIRHSLREVPAPGTAATRVREGHLQRDLNQRPWRPCAGWQPVLLEFWAAEPSGAQEIRTGTEPARKTRMQDLRVCTEQSPAHTNNWITLPVAKQLPDTVWNSQSPLRNKIPSSDGIQRQGFRVWGVIGNTVMSYGRVPAAIGAPLWLCKEGFYPPPRNAKQTAKHLLGPHWHFFHWLLMLIIFNITEYTDFAILAFQLSLCLFFSGKVLG